MNVTPLARCELRFRFGFFLVWKTSTATTTYWEPYSKLPVPRGTLQRTLVPAVLTVILTIEVHACRAHLHPRCSSRWALLLLVSTPLTLYRQDCSALLLCKTQTIPESVSAPTVSNLHTLDPRVYCGLERYSYDANSRKK